MLNFNLQNGKVAIDPYSMMLKCIKNVLKEYNSDPDEAIKVLTYIHIVAKIDPKAPFFGAKDSEIRELAVANIWNNIPKADRKKLDFTAYDDYIKEYKKAYEGPEARVVNIFNNKIDQISELIKNTSPEIVKYTTTSGSQGFATNTNMITKAMNDLDALLDAKDKLQARMEKQGLKEGKIKGKTTPSRLEKAMMKEQTS